MGWRDKISLFFRSPSGQPRGREAPERLAMVNPSPVKRNQATVSVVLFLLCTACTAALLWRVDALGRASLGAVVACLIAGLWSIGAVLDRRLTPGRGATVGIAAATTALVLLVPT